MTTKTTTYSTQDKVRFRSKISVGACSACVVVRRILIILLLCTILTLLSTFFFACGHDVSVVPDEYPEEPPTPYIELRIVIPAVNPYLTRSHPMGGEDGNGRERGILNEDKIHDVNIFFYKDDAGLDGDDNTKILHHIYFNIDNLHDADNSPLMPETRPEFEKNYLNLKFDLAEKFAELGEGTNFAAIANIGFIQDNDIKTLKDLRELNVSDYSNNSWSTYDPFSVNAATMDYFLMSTAYNQNWSYGDEETGYQSTGTNKIEKTGKNYSGTTTLERMYARIDFWYNAQTNAGIAPTTDGGVDKSDRLEYGVDATDNKVYICNILPVNVMRQPTFLFKKVTSFPGPPSWELEKLKNLDKFNWGGKEMVLDGCPSNYVLEPNTLLKSREGNSGNLDDWFGSSKAASVIADIKDDGKGRFSSYYSRYQVAEGNDPTGYDCNRVSIISYANENTHATDCFHSNYLTGMAFRAVYVPAKIYKSYDPNTKLPIEMTEAEKASFVISETDKNTKIYRYSRSKDGDASESKALYFTDRGVLEDYEKDHLDDSAVVTAFDAVREPVNNLLGFVCYYNLWLRHYNNENADPQSTYPMEYATVRNNIYRVAVSFIGPGDPTPTMREPDTMQARIFVRKWNLRKEQNPLQF